MMGAFLLLVVAGGLMLLAVMSGATKPRRGVKKPYHNGATQYDPALVAQRWTEIQAMTQTPSGLKQSLIEADKLLDYVLKGRGYAGETMADRMKKAQTQWSRREAVWAAHKLRNVYVHEVAHDVVPVQVQRAVADLGQAIRDMGVQISG